MSEREQLEQAIDAQERLRGLVDDEVIELTLASLRERLAGLAEPVRRRRQATVLFADVSGFTAMASELDAEIVSDTMDEVWSRIDAILLEHGAHIDKHIGDAVMALWGAEESHEGDPERAIRAALELQRALQEHREAKDLDLTMRIGITTGPVVFAEVGSTHEFTAMGDTVNVAARLEHAAPLGAILISHETYRHVRGLFDALLQPPLTVKGKSEPLRVYVVQREKPRSFHMPTRGVEGVETRTVGRDAELQSMRDAFESVAAGRGAELVVLTGDAGVGKSRLLDEFTNWVNVIPETVWYFRARGFATRRNAPHGVARDLIASRFDIRDSDESAVVAVKLTEGFAPHLSHDEALLVGSWLGFEITTTTAVEQLKSSTSFAQVGAAHLAHYIRALSSAATVLVALEDLHWADDESVDVIAQLTERLADAPLLVIGTTRPQITDRCSRWFDRATAVTRLGVEPLPLDASRALVAEVLHELDPVPAVLADLIVARADGNPYYVEELAKMLIDDGVIVMAEPGEPWSVDLDRLDAGNVPPTLTGVLEARLDSLPGRGREALQRASVVGRVFWEEAVLALQPDATAEESSEALRTAAARELIERQVPSTLDAGNEYIFAHALLRDVTYGTVLLRDRPSLHVLAAEWLTANAGARIGELLEVIAEHLRFGGKPIDAADLYRRSAARSLAVGRSASALRSIEQALAAWTQAGIGPPHEALILQAEASCRVGDLGGASAALEQVPDWTADPEWAGEAMSLGAWIAGERGDRTAERALLEQGLPFAEATGGITLIRLVLGQGWAAMARGASDDVDRCARRALELARGADLQAYVCRSLNLLTLAASELRDDLDEAQAHAESALEIARSIGDLEMQAHTVGNLGVVHHLRGDATGSATEYARAAEYYRDGIALNERLGLRNGLANACANYAQASLRLGDADGCRSNLITAIAIARQYGFISVLNLALIVGAEWMVATGDSDGFLTLMARLRDEPSMTASQHHEMDVVLRRAHDQFGVDPDAVDDQPRPWDDVDLVDLAIEIRERFADV